MHIPDFCRAPPSQNIKRCGELGGAKQMYRDTLTITIAPTTNMDSDNSEPQHGVIICRGGTSSFFNASGMKLSQKFYLDWGIPT